MADKGKDELLESARNAMTAYENFRQQVKPLFAECTQAEATLRHLESIATKALQAICQDVLEVKFGGKHYSASLNSLREIESEFSEAGRYIQL